VSGTSEADLQATSSEDDTGLRRGHWGRFDILGLAGVVVVGLLVLVPALAHGASLGPYDILQSSGLNKIPDVQVHSPTALDQIRLFIPWTNLAWTQVHSGHLPLWNPYSALGMPLAFNWESAPLSLPVLVGYLFPVQLAYTAQIVVTLVIAGTGVYVLGKVLRLGVLGCMMAAIVFELSGPLMALLGWPESSVMAWGGWLFAAVLLVLRGEKRGPAIVLLAVVTAFALYAGDPEGVLLLALSAAVLAAAMLLFRAPALGGSGPVIRPATDLGLAALAGTALAAPLILPGLQVAKASNRTVVGPTLLPKGLPPDQLVHLIFQGFDGLPLLHDQWFGLSAYEGNTAYVGVLGLVLAATALILRWRRPEVRSLGLVAVVMGLLVFVPPLVSALDSSVARIYWVFAITPAVLAVAALSGMGMDILVHSFQERTVRRVVGIGFAAMAVVLGIIWLVDRGGLTPSQLNIRSHSFIWPTVAVIVGLVVVWALAKRSAQAWAHRLSPSLGAGSVAGLVLLLVESAFLVASGAPLLSSSPHYPTSTREVAALKRAVGNGVVGFGTSPTFSLRAGVLTNDNLFYDVQEFATYDPMTPHAYFSLAKTPGSAVAEAEDIFSPAITTLQAARLYGINYLLEPIGVPAPKGSVFDRTIGNEDLYRVPGAASATLVATRPSGPLPGKYAPGTPVSVAHPSPSTWMMSTSSTAPSVLRLRLTDEPGWHATVDGKPVELRHFAGVMLQLRVPAGHHVVELRYWPNTFTIGIVLAVFSVFGLAMVLLVPRIRRRSPGDSERRSDQGSPVA
jgi:hypothetical protein